MLSVTLTKTLIFNVEIIIKYAFKKENYQQQLYYLILIDMYQYIHLLSNQLLEVNIFHSNK